MTTTTETTTSDRERLLAWADRAQRMSAASHRRGDYIACMRQLATARRYRDLAYRMRAA